MPFDVHGRVRLQARASSSEAILGGLQLLEGPGTATLGGRAVASTVKS